MSKEYIKYTKEDYFNPTGPSPKNERIHESDPLKKSQGLLNMSDVRYGWSKSIYSQMQNNTWFKSEPDTTSEESDFKKLSQNKKDIYKKVFANLSFNDSAQAKYLTDFESQTNNQMVKAVLKRQGYEEVNHSEGYVTLLDKTGSTEEVFNLFRTVDPLREKNDAIADHFAKAISGERFNVNRMLLSAMASVNLESIFFQTGFSFIYAIGDEVPGAASMVQFIARDELDTHLPLFKNIYKTLIRENSFDAKTIDKVHNMMAEAVDIELKFATHIAEEHPILGINKSILTNTVHNFANDRMTQLGYQEMYESNEKTYLEKLLEEYRDMNRTKVNTFEATVKNYQKDALEDDF